MTSPLEEQKSHLSYLLVAVQRSAWFLHQSANRIHWPLNGITLQEHRKDVAFFETLAAINERFSKLQDTLASTMRHTAILVAEPAEPFLKILAFYEKVGVLSSIQEWQELRMIRNMAAHDYDIDENQIAEHFNAIHELLPILFDTAANLLEWIKGELAITPVSDDFKTEFEQVLSVR